MKVPESYRSILLEYNGGYPEREYFRGLGIRFYPLGHLDLDLGEMVSVYQTSPTHEHLKDLFPFADSYETTFAFVGRGDDLGKVYWIDETGERTLVCDSFDAFMAELSDNGDY